MLERHWWLRMLSKRKPNRHVTDANGRKIVVGNIVKIPKYGRWGTRIMIVVRINKHTSRVRARNIGVFRQIGTTQVMNSDMIRWEIEDRL